ncbi:hypothetical protein Agub_g1122 [Astrephomene gubernaculifera]|uniref:Uncharacterized protein n=1 Tax=Astrephomene gubernaculifera TaxID=47775 RepID=A0AAD3DGW7_9CHLO|nr:hypothetical protein Agub_g1122 [Astrephomene gubernaculifera]
MVSCLALECFRPGRSAKERQQQRLQALKELEAIQSGVRSPTNGPWTTGITSLKGKVEEPDCEGETDRDLDSPSYSIEDRHVILEAGCHATRAANRAPVTPTAPVSSARDNATPHGHHVNADATQSCQRTAPCSRPSYATAASFGNVGTPSSRLQPVNEARALDEPPSTPPSTRPMPAAAAASLSTPDTRTSAAEAPTATGSTVSCSPLPQPTPAAAPSAASPLGISVSAVTAQPGSLPASSPSTPAPSGPTPLLAVHVTTTAASCCSSSSAVAATATTTTASGPEAQCPAGQTDTALPPTCAGAAVAGGGDCSGGGGKSSNTSPCNGSGSPPCSMGAVTADPDTASPPAQRAQAAAATASAGAAASTHATRGDVGQRCSGACSTSSSPCCSQPGATSAGCDAAAPQGRSRICTGSAGNTADAGVSSSTDVSFGASSVADTRRSSDSVSTDAVASAVVAGIKSGCVGGAHAHTQSCSASSKPSCSASSSFSSGGPKVAASSQAACSPVATQGREQAQSPVEGGGPVGPSTRDSHSNAAPSPAPPSPGVPALGVQSTAAAVAVPAPTGPQSRQQSPPQPKLPAQQGGSAGSPAAATPVAAPRPGGQGAANEAANAGFHTPVAAPKPPASPASQSHHQPQPLPPMPRNAAAPSRQPFAPSGSAAAAPAAQPVQRCSPFAPVYAAPSPYRGGGSGGGVGKSSTTAAAASAQPPRGSPFISLYGPANLGAGASGRRTPPPPGSFSSASTRLALHDVLSNRPSRARAGGVGGSGSMSVSQLGNMDFRPRWR